MRSTAPALDDDVYNLPSMPAATDAILTEWQHTASYTLDQPVRCPHCDERISVVHIVGLTRSQVAFTSTLPRKGRIIVCPECERILTAEL